ncbi:DnaJ domain-containing protein [Paenibacillus luteus]|uniref:DnaJ domain-containing protein n=1 Tax=Paenibacillus luteus TaxID=2545753 RepID=UPI00137576BB|nr:DnaJ domain-containing protein [Paenibacillus luteus]
MKTQKRTSHVFSTSLPEIEAELAEFLCVINAADKTTGNAVLEIGRRLVFVKENHTKHGEWIPWLKRVGIAKRTAQSYVKAFEQFGNVPLAALLSASKMFELASLPPEINISEFLACEHTVPSSGEQKTVSLMTKEEIREVVRFERERVGLVKPKQPKPAAAEKTQPPTNRFDSLTLDQDKRDILYGMPLAAALRVADLESVEMNAMLNVASKLSGRLFAENYTEILADVDGGKKASDIIRKYKKPANKQPLSGLTIDPYEILGVWDGDSDADVKRKYRALVQKVHPDKGGSELLFKIVNAAWEAYQDGY